MAQENKTVQEQNLKIVPKDTKSPQTNKEIEHAAVIAAWQRFIDYDTVSTEQKKAYHDIRSWVITLGLLTSAGAVFTTYIGIPDRSLLFQIVLFLPLLSFLIMGGYYAYREKSLIVGFKSLGKIGTFPLAVTFVIVAISLFIISLDISRGDWLRVLLIIMPIASVALMNYASEFATSTDWIDYRYAAERIRSEIYKYRMGAGEYTSEVKQENQRKLLDTVAQIDLEVAKKQNLKAEPFIQTTYKDILKRINDLQWVGGEKNDGLQPMTIDQYIEWRSKDQLDWYINKIQKDYSSKQRDRRLALVIAGIGSVFAGIGAGLETLVAITTAIGVTLALQTESRMYGATYGIFHHAALRVQNELSRWNVFGEENRKEQDNIIQFVNRIEAIFAEEREEWRKQAMQLLQANEQSILSNVQPGSPAGSGGTDVVDNVSNSDGAVG